ncbi:type III polyketide synthase [Streptoalloteichus hindustanus]|uniref:Isopalmitoylresorcinol synthase n=1 Tax=Streptoalloteichus hindustanus TaxID=2017 RepID=A0A1M4YIN3_STRHI|nr:3-oxoacyl-[acyl-carrier-protein] synthase III C-terminal domain-containing protein [Streptoalloteichus hindustanus]SHF05483.1 isopalmitoylresorcinol synthase [Streptoalloteichus hindustanus]
MSRIAAVHVALPPHVYPQREITEAFTRMCGHDRAVVRRFHEAVGVSTRHLALPLDAYPQLADFGAANDAFLRCALDLAEHAVKGALTSAGLAPVDVDLVLSTSVTGLGVPSVEARLAHRVGLRADVKRLPLFGLGCVAGAAGVARAHDYLRGHPGQVALLLAVELCSLTVQRDDASTANLVASGLFGDGAAAVVLLGADRAPAGSGPAGKGSAGRGPSVVAARSRLYPDSERVMGWEIDGRGFRIVLSAEVPAVVRRHLGGDVRRFLADAGLDLPAVTTWICHPGGPKVLQALQRALDLPDEALALTRRSLDRVGNMSSVSVLAVLADTIDRRPGRPGESGLLLAMGPGFCSELVLLQW